MSLFLKLQKYSRAFCTIEKCVLDHPTVVCVLHFNIANIAPNENIIFHNKYIRNQEEMS